MPNSDVDVEHYGVCRAEINSDLREIRLSVKRSGSGRNRLLDSEVQRCVNWALSCTRERYPDYHISAVVKSFEKENKV